MTGPNSPGTEIAVFIEDVFDYSHFLPEADSSYPIHGHTSYVRLEALGEVTDTGMIIDFRECRAILKNVLKEFDHKVITNKKYTVTEGRGGARETVLSYGKFSMRLPEAQWFLLDGEATSENITLAIARRLIEEMPAGIRSVRLTVTEGRGKGTTAQVSRAR